MKKYIGKTFALNGIANMLYIVVVTGFEEAGPRYESDSYVGKQTTILQNGQSFTTDWACCKKAFEKKTKKRIR